MEHELERALQGVGALYRDGLLEHGPQPRSVGWRDPDSHRLRFERLALLLADERDPVSVADWGCGYGALFGFLDSRRAPPLAAYAGYDLSAEMVEAARGLVPDRRASFVVGGELDRDVDYTFVSGTFNVRLEATVETWERYVRETLRALAARSRKGLAFNLLTSHVDWREDHLHYADPAAYFDFCKRELASRVTLLHDYPLYEWTMLVHTG